MEIDFTGITKEPLFHQEKADIFRAGLRSTGYQQMDDTSSNVHSQNRYAQIVCNPYYTAYFTTPRKDRLTVLDVLRGDPDGESRSYLERLNTSRTLFQVLGRLNTSRTVVKFQA